MTKRIIIPLLFLTLSACAIGQHNVKVNVILADTSFDSTSLQKLKEAAASLELVFNSKEFSDKVLNTNFSTGNFKLSSADILMVIKSGMDNYKDMPKDGSIDLRLKLFDAYLGYGNFGTTDMVTRITQTHRCYVLHNDIKCYISHLSHEYMHQIGFYDTRSWRIGRGFGKKNNSVPYLIGDIVDDLINNTKPCYAKEETCVKD